MRTTIDLPDDLFRTLKVRAASSGITLRALIQQLIEEGLNPGIKGKPAYHRRRQPPPVIIPSTGQPIAAVSRKKANELDEIEDERKNARST